MKIISWNVRSLVKNFVELSLILNDSNIDIININESWLGSDNSNSQFRLSGFKIYRNDREGRKKGGGLCTYVKANLKCDAQVYSNLNLSNQHLEALVLDIKLPQTRPIIMINLYRPPSGKISEGIDQLQNILNQLPTNAELFIAGDFNIDLSKENSPSHQAMKGFEHLNSLMQLINDSTRITNRSNTLIDHIYTNSEIIKYSGTLNINISDHLPIFTIRKKPKQETLLVTFECRKLTPTTH